MSCFTHALATPPTIVNAACSIGSSSFNFATIAWLAHNGRLFVISVARRAKRLRRLTSRGLAQLDAKEREKLVTPLSKLR
jgi:hypothetical protein